MTGEQALRGHAMVADVRLGQLAQAIRARDWEQVEWHYDRLARSVDKLAVLAGAKPDSPGT